MSHTRQLLLCAACSNELSKVGDGSLLQLHAGQLATVSGDIDVLITGVGVFQTVYNLTNTLREGNYGMVIAVGIAGDYHFNRELCRTFAVRRSTFADCGFESFDGKFVPIAGSIFLDANEYPFCDGYIHNNASCKLASTMGLPTATVNTVSRTCTKAEYVNQMLQRFPADLETMESAAFSFVCAKRHIDYVEIRSTSNHVVPVKTEQWQLDGSLRALGTHVDTILEEFCR